MLSRFWRKIYARTSFSQNPFADEGAAKSVGIEICSQARIPNVGSRPNLNYMIQDITTPDAAELIGTNYDLIVVHDVIEHIPLNKKDSFVGALKQFCGNNTLKNFLSNFKLLSMKI